MPAPPEPAARRRRRRRAAADGLALPAWQLERARTRRGRAPARRARRSRARRASLSSARSAAATRWFAVANWLGCEEWSVPGSNRRPPACKAASRALERPANPAVLSRFATVQTLARPWQSNFAAAPASGLHRITSSRPAPLETARRPRTRTSFRRACLRICSRRGCRGRARRTTGKRHAAAGSGVHGRPTSAAPGSGSS